MILIKILILSDYDVDNDDVYIYKMMIPWMTITIMIYNTLLVMKLMAMMMMAKKIIVMMIMMFVVVDSGPSGSQHVCTEHSSVCDRGGSVHMGGRIRGDPAVC